MNKFSQILFVLCALSIVVSLFERAQSQRQRVAELTAQSAFHMYAQSYNNAGRSLALLAELQKGDTSRAIESLESDLATDLIVLMHYSKEAGVSNSDSNLVQELQEIRDYRMQYPSTMTALTDADIAKAFAYFNVPAAK